MKFLDDEESITKNWLDVDQPREDFCSIISSYWHRLSNIDRQGESKCLLTKNSTNDQYESFLNSLPGNVIPEEDEEEGFEIKSGLGRLKGLPLAHIDQPLCNSVDTFNSIFDAKVKKNLTNEWDVAQIEINSEFKFWVNFIQIWTRFSSEFIIEDLEMQICAYHTGSDSKKNTGKLELIWNNIIDNQAYAITIIDPERYEGTAMNAVYALSAIRDGNPYVCKYFGSWKEQGMVFIQTETCDKTLKNLFINSAPKQTQLLQLVKEGMSGIEYCHRKGLAGLNISLETIFFSETKHYKLKSLENCIKRESEFGDNDSLFQEAKIKDYNDFTAALQKLLTSNELISKVHEHAKVLESVYKMLDDENTFAEFTITY